MGKHAIEYKSLNDFRDGVEVCNRSKIGRIISRKVGLLEKWGDLRHFEARREDASCQRKIGTAGNNWYKNLWTGLDDGGWEKSRVHADRGMA